MSHALLSLHSYYRPVIRGFLWFFIGICAPGWVLAQQQYASSRLLPGEGAIALLKRFGIYNDCNLTAFFSINNLTAKTPLSTAKTYFLPVLIYTYNGQSIRSTIDDEDLDRALRIQAFNEEMLLMGHKAGDFRKDKILWVPYDEVKCQPVATAPKASEVRMADVPSGSRIGPFPIFGEAYQMVPLYDRRLDGCVFYLLSGHGGPDPGAEASFNGHILSEDEYAYDIMLRLARALMTHGATVYIIVRDPNDGIREDAYLEQDTDERCWVDKAIPRSQKLRLTQRTDVVNALYLEHKRKGAVYQRCLDLHIDSEASTLAMDMSFFYKYRSKPGQAFAVSLNNSMERQYEKNQPGRNYRGFLQARDLHVVRETLPVSLLVELGNLQNSRDRKRFILPDNRRLLAEWLCEALLADAEEHL